MKATFQVWVESTENIKITCPNPECDMVFFVHASAGANVWTSQLVDFCPYCGVKLEYDGKAEAQE
jgi:hypothetical protein